MNTEKYQIDNLYIFKIGNLCFIKNVVYCLKEQGTWEKVIENIPTSSTVDVSLGFQHSNLRYKEITPMETLIRANTLWLSFGTPENFYEGVIIYPINI